MNSVDVESVILAQNLKNERTAIPVKVTAAVESQRINPDDYMDESLKAMEDSLKCDLAEAKNTFDKARKEEKKTKAKLVRRKAIRKGKSQPKNDEEKG